MSGGGGSGPSYYDTSSTATFDCSNLVERTYINSPIPSVVARLTLGARLDVQLVSGAGGPVLMAALSGTNVGSLTPPRLPQIISCIQQGFAYVAVVQQIDGGQVKVEIRPP